MMSSNLSNNQQGRLLKVLSYNIHRSIGISRRKNISKVASVIREIDPDIVALQEVENIPSDFPESEQLSFLAAQTGLKAVPGPTLIKTDGDYGNAILSRLPILEIRHHDISYPRKEPRGALDVDLSLGNGKLRVISTHLGLKAAERRFQADRLKQEVFESEVKPVVLMGDMNEWLPNGRSIRFFHNYFGSTPLLRTFPAIFPIFPLDRIFVSPNKALIKIQTFRSSKSLTASDHLPLLAILKI
jgi:endonuclease/exonuclease/phosphatase family metal-dependent hydrolase